MKEKFMDGYEARYQTMDDFENELFEHQVTQRMLDVNVSEDLRVISVDDCLTVNPELARDTREHTGLCMSVDGEVIPLRGCALYALQTMCGVKDTFVSRLTPAELAEVLSRYALPKFRKGRKVLLFVQDKKVTGILGSRTYKAMPSLAVYQEARNFLGEWFPGFGFREGYFSHEMVYFSFDLTSYADDFRAVLGGVKLTPVFTIQTSDCGLCSVTFRPYLADGGIQIPLNPLRIQHKGASGDDPMEAIRDALNQCYSLIDKGVSDLERLAAIRIEHPHTTLLRVMKDFKINQKAGLSVAENYRDSWGLDATAWELYKCICETQMYLPADQSAGQKFRCADDIARAAAANWKKYDLPGDFTW